jgi:hypothetical protein
MPLMPWCCEYFGFDESPIMKLALSALMAPTRRAAPGAGSGRSTWHIPPRTRAAERTE